ncbi:MAG: Ig-like domain-containing protein [Syntrophomonas sp.]|nr:Ig-like domain-containing protein [Syntrophomonas sp.]
MDRIMRWLTAVAMVVVLVLSPLPAQAGDGDGDGSGGNQNNPLVIESSVPANGAAGVTNLEYIKLVFSKNVVYMTIRDQNSRCVSLWSGSQRIAADIILADDQIEREKRNDVLIKPKQPLQVGTTYRVEVAPEMQSKSGVTLGQKATITFTMAGKAPAADTGAEAKNPSVTSGDAPKTQPPGGTLAPDQTVTSDPAGSGTEAPAKPGDETSGTTPATAGQEPASAQDNPALTGAAEDSAAPAESDRRLLLWLGAAAVALAAAGIIYRKRSQG